MIWILVVLTILLMGGVALVAAGYGDSMRPAQADRRRVRLPEGELSPEDLLGVEFNTDVRGYRMEEVDALLARLAQQLVDAQTSDTKPSQES